MKAGNFQKLFFHSIKDMKIRVNVRNGLLNATEFCMY